MAFRISWRLLRPIVRRLIRAYWISAALSLAISVTAIGLEIAFGPAHIKQLVGSLFCGAALACCVCCVTGIALEAVYQDPSLRRFKVAVFTSFSVVMIVVLAFSL